MISSVSSNLSSLASVQAASAQAPAATAQEAAQAVPASQSSDTVEISDSAKVKQLHNAGSTISEIALKTSLDQATIKTYLGV